MTSNFDFLQAKFPDLAEFGRKGESHLYSDPNACFFKLRALGEQVVNLMFHFDHIEDRTDHSQAQRIRYLKWDEYLPGNVADSLNAIRVMGNKAVHENFHSVEKAALCLKIAYGVCEWFMETYGDYTYTHRDFVLPARPSALRPAPLLAKVTTPEEKKLARAAAEQADHAPVVAKAQRVRQGHHAAYHRNISEEETRYLIDQELRRVGWEVDTEELTYAKGARPQKGHNRAIAEWPVQPADGKTGDPWRMDYALFAGTRLVGLIEAKRLSKRVNTVLDDQCRDYATHIRPEDMKYCVGRWGSYQVPFLFATNGRPYLKQLKVESGIWFRDARHPDEPPRALLGWMSPKDLTEKLAEDTERTDWELTKMPDTLLTDPQGLSLRPYQVEAVKAAEQAVAEGRQHLLLAMATGTGKTRVILAMMYRFLKSHRFHRILYLVDRNNLGEQAFGMFTSVKLEQGHTLNSIYDINPLDKTEITDSTRVQIATVQSMVRRLFGREDEEEIPSVRTFDLIIVDEAHRGYIHDRDMGEDEFLYRDQADYQSKYRQVLDYFDAVKIGVTATPALQTTDIFGMPIYKYSYRQAVIDGYLVDYDAPVRIETEQSRDGIHFKAGEEVKLFRPGETPSIETATLPDDVDYDVEDFNRGVVAEGFNRAVLTEIAEHFDPGSPRLSGKMLIFAVNDRHADQIVQILKEIYRDSGFPLEAICKITGTSFGGDRKKIQNAIKRFRNEEFPSLVVTVDLLSTGVDVPSITNLVFLRRVKSRILFEQMMGRATRPCPEIKKDKFTVYDCVGLFDHMQAVTDMKPVAVNPSSTFKNLLDGLKAVTGEASVRGQVDQIVAKLQRRWQRLTEETKREVLSTYDAADVKELSRKLRAQSPQEAKKAILSHEPLWLSLDDYGNALARPVLVNEKKDTLAHVGRGYGKDGSETKPEDYLEAFSHFVKLNRNRINALEILCTRPRDLTRDDLTALRKELSKEGFTEVQLNTAIRQVSMRDAAADIISLVRRAALGSPLVSHAERIHRAVEKLRAAHHFNARQNNWLTLFEDYLMNDNVLNHDTLDRDSRFRSKGGFRIINKSFDNRLDDYLAELSGNLYDDPEGGKSA